MRRLRQSNPTGQITKSLSIPTREKISLPSSGKSVILICPSHPIRGDVRTSRTLRWDAVDAMTARDERLISRTAKSCGPDAPTLAFKLATMLAHRADEGGKKARSPGRARSKP
jgi:hypothetical protein